MSKVCQILGMLVFIFSMSFCMILDSHSFKCSIRIFESEFSLNVSFRKFLPKCFSFFYFFTISASYLSSSSSSDLFWVFSFSKFNLVSSQMSRIPSKPKSISLQDGSSFTIAEPITISSISSFFVFGEGSFSIVLFIELQLSLTVHFLGK